MIKLSFGSECDMHLVVNVSIEPKEIRQRKKVLAYLQKMID